MPGRRTVLQATVAVSSALVGGCLQGWETTRTGERTPTEEAPTEVRLWFERASVSESERASIDPIVFSDLPKPEKKTVRTALQDGEYTERVGEVSGPMQSLRERIEARVDEGIEAYLLRESTYYRIGYVDGDHIVANP